MSREQRDFYKHLLRELRSARFPRVEGNISYLFTYVYTVVARWNHDGFDVVYRDLIRLAEEYYDEPVFADYCRSWANDCLLGKGEYDLFLEVTEPENPISVSTHKSNERCNVAYYLKREAHPLDIVKMFGGKFTRFTKENVGAFRACLIQTFEEDLRENGSWLARLLKSQAPAPTYGHSLFAGCPVSTPPVKFPYYCFYASYDMGDIVREVVRRAENLLRETNKLPRVGEGWISETSLYYSIKNAFPQTPVIQHGRPDWLGAQHLDVWLPEWKIGVEYHGAQHFKPVEIFGGSQGFDATQKRDSRKANLCAKNNVPLIVATEETNHDLIIHQITELHENQMPTD
jgi:hypothetical protein